jgi:hypothetical protein
MAIFARTDLQPANFLPSRSDLLHWSYQDLTERPYGHGNHKTRPKPQLVIQVLDFVADLHHRRWIGAVKTGQRGLIARRYGFLPFIEGRE